MRVASILLLIVALGALALSGCRYSNDELSSDKNGAPIDDGDRASGCEVATDCTLAASTCCECPSFALPATGGFTDGCEEVNCESYGLCPAVEAACEQGQCVAICSPIITNKTCSFGFLVDQAGCLTNICAPPLFPGTMSSECEVEADCQKIPADCCGCAFGGKDMAGPSADPAPLDCPDEPSCPNIDVCDVLEVAACIAGTCTLMSSGTGFEDPSAHVLCGTPELSSCPIGSHCVLNAITAKDVSGLGVGVCIAI